MVTSLAALGTLPLDQFSGTFQSPSPGLIQKTGLGPAGTHRSSSGSRNGRRRRVRTGMAFRPSVAFGRARPPVAAVELEVAFTRRQRAERRVAPHRLAPER